MTAHPEKAPSSENQPEKKPIERFEDLHIDEDDVIHSKTGTIREVQEIIYDPARAGGGYLIVERVDTKGERTVEDIDFHTLIRAQSAIDKIEKRSLDLRDPRLTPRQRAAVKQIRQQLRSPELPHTEQSRLKEMYQQIVQQLNKGPANSDTTDSPTPDSQ